MPDTVSKDLHGLRESEGEDGERVHHEVTEPLTVKCSPKLVQLLQQLLSSRELGSALRTRKLTTKGIESLQLAPTLHTD